MSEFTNRLKQLNPSGRGRNWVFVSYDQLSDEIGPLSREDPFSLGVVLIESTAQVSRRPYHKQKIAYLWANMRHFAIEQARRRVAIRYLSTEEPFSKTLHGVYPELGPIRLMKPAERELRQDLESLIREGMIELLPHEGWLTHYCTLTLSVGSSPFIIAHDMERAQQERELRCLVVEVSQEGPASIEIQAAYFGDD